METFELEPHLSQVTCGEKVDLVVVPLWIGEKHSLVKTLIRGQSLFVDMKLPVMPKITIFQAAVTRHRNCFWLCRNEKTSVVGHSAIQTKDAMSMRETCAGIGVVTNGFMQCGVHTSVHNDSNLPFSDWLRKHGKHVITGDINDSAVLQQMAQFPGMFMSAGISCQPFSYLGDGKQQYDERSKSFTGTLKGLYLLQVKAIILECTPAAKDSEWIQSILKSYADQTGFQVHQQVLDLHTFWVSRRTRWWCTVTAPELHVSSIPPIPKLPFCPSFLHLFPKMMDMTVDDLEELSVDLYELRHFHGHPFLEKHLMDPFKTLPTATHSWGSQVKGCKCGCRQSGFHEQRLQERGLYGQIIQTGGEITNGTQVYRRCRHLHPCEIALANGLVPSYVGNLKGQRRLEMAGVGQMASPFQGAWVLANVLKDIHLNCFPLPHFREPMDIMQSMALGLLHARDVLLGFPKHSPSNQILEQAIQQWGQSPVLPAQVSMNLAQTAPDRVNPEQLRPEQSLSAPSGRSRTGQTESDHRQAGDQVQTMPDMTNQTQETTHLCHEEIWKSSSDITNGHDIWGSHDMSRMDLVPHDQLRPLTKVPQVTADATVPFAPMHPNHASVPVASDAAVTSDHAHVAPFLNTGALKVASEKVSAAIWSPSLVGGLPKQVIFPDQPPEDERRMSHLHQAKHTHCVQDVLSNMSELPKSTMTPEVLDPSTPVLPIPGPASSNGSITKELKTSHRMGRENPLLESKEMDKKIEKQPGTRPQEPEKMTQQPGPGSREPEKNPMKQPGSGTPKPASPKAMETRGLPLPMSFHAMPTVALDPAALPPAHVNMEPTEFQSSDAHAQMAPLNAMPSDDVAPTEVSVPSHFTDKPQLLHGQVHSTSLMSAHSNQPLSSHVDHVESGHQPYRSHAHSVGFSDSMSEKTNNAEVMTPSHAHVPTHIDLNTGGFQAFANANRNATKRPIETNPDLDKTAKKVKPSMQAEELEDQSGTSSIATVHAGVGTETKSNHVVGLYDTPSQEELDLQIQAHLDKRPLEEPSTAPAIAHEPEEPYHLTHATTSTVIDDSKQTKTVYVTIKGEAVFSHEIHEGCTAGQLACAIADMHVLTQPIRISTPMGTQIPLQEKLQDGHFVMLEEHHTVQEFQEFQCPLTSQKSVPPSLTGYTREQGLWMQQGWVTKDEMEFYLHMLESYQPSSTLGVVELPDNGERDAVMTHHLIKALSLAHNDINCNCKVIVFLHDNHWTLCVAEARGDLAIVHVPVDAYKMTLGGFTGQVVDHEVQFTMHPMPHAFRADCGFQAVGWILSRLLDEDTSVPFTVRQACQWRYLCQQNLAYSGLAKEVMLVNPRMGGMNQVKDRLQELVISHGVHPERGHECAEQLLHALGTKVIQQILVSPKPWADLKARASLHQPPIRVVLADELQKQIQKRIKDHQPVGKKSNKTKGGKNVKKPIRLSADQLSIPSAVFRQDDGQEVSQIHANQIGPTGQGIVLTNIEEAIPYFGLSSPVSQHGLALLILDHDDSRVPSTCPVIKVPAKCTATEEPMIVSTAVVQIGAKTIERNLPAQCLEVPEVSNQVIRIQIYKDQFPSDWNEFVQKPVKTLTSMHPFTDLDPNAILDVWDRQFMTLRLTKVPHQEAQLFMVNMRIDTSAIATLMKTNGEEGRYIELRNHNGRQPLESQKIVWLPGKAYADAQVLQRTSTIPTALVRQGDRYGLRTDDQHAEALHKQHRPDLIYIHGADLRRYRVGPMPFGSTKQSLVHIFQKWKWQARPIGPQKQADDRSGIMWQVQAAEEPSHWIFQLAHGDVLITPEDKATSTDLARPTIFASTKTMSSLQLKHKEVTKDDPWLYNDPWKSPGSTKELSVGQVAAIQANVVNNVLEKLKSTQGDDDDEMNGHQDGRLTALEHKFEQLSAQMQQQQHDQTAHQRQVQAQIQGLDRKIDQQQQLYHSALDSKLEQQMARIEMLFASQSDKRPRMGE
eukprot:s729_g3.t1